MMGRLSSTSHNFFVAAALNVAVFCYGPGFAEGQATTPPKKAAPAAVKPATPAPKATAPAGGGAKSAAAGTASSAGHSGPTTAHAGGPTTAPTGGPTTKSAASGPTTAGHGVGASTAAHTPTAGARPGETGRSGEAGHMGGPGARADVRPGGGPRGGVAGVQHGNMAHAGPAGSHDRMGPHGEAVRMRPNGHPADIHRAGMDIHHNLGGGRRVEMERADHSRLYYERGRPGYIAHPYAFRGHEYDRRSYYYNGRAYDRFYNRYEYRPGVYLDVYAPARYYGVGFYGWAYNPWAVPVAYSWGFAANPWYGYYGAYFTPYPVYASPSLWLTDYLISTSLAAAYDAHVAAQAQAEAAGTAPPAPMTAETKQMIADEVKRQVALENAEAQANASQKEADAQSGSIARILSDGQPHVFVPGKEFDLTASSGQECAVTDGDVLQLKAPPAADATSADLVVLSSKGGVECPRMTTVSVPLEDLQDMQNHMRETIDLGLADLQAKQGKGGLPSAPPSATAPPVSALVAQNAPPPDPAGAQDLAKQAQDSEKAEQEVLQTTAATGAGDVAVPTPTPAPVQTLNLAVGQSMADVLAAAGQPTEKRVGATQTTFIYPDRKVVFNNKSQKVSDVQ